MGGESDSSVDGTLSSTLISVVSLSCPWSIPVPVRGFLESELFCDLKRGGVGCVC